MTLRTRLIAGIAAIVVTLTVCGGVITAVQRDRLLDQLDRQLETFAGNAARAPATLQGARSLGTPRDIVTDAYLGALLPDGSLRTLVAPGNDPDLRPDLDDLDDLGDPGAFTVATTAGDAARLRAVTTTVGDLTIVLAIPMTDVDATVRSLTTTLLLGGGAVVVVSGLFAWSMIRHGLRPIREITDTAEAITDGATDRRVAEAPGATEAARLSRAFNTMVDSTQAAEAQRERFVANVSHELRTPLTTLRGYSDLYERGALPDDVAVDDAMRRIHAEATRMQGIVDQLLVLVDLDERHEFEPEPVDVAPLLRDIASDIAVIQPNRPVIVTVHDASVVIADRDQLIQALMAFTSNALRYTHLSTEIELYARHEGDGVRLAVADRGPGVAEQDRAHVFERFYRADPGRTRTVGGSGLGLAIVAAIAEANRGTYGVEPTRGGGATFWIRLPVAAPTTDTQDETRARRVAAQSGRTIS
ncbi:MAG: sensor histidine kinase [Ilumatobacter sp.]